MAARLFISNDGPGVGYSYEEVEFQYNVSGNLTATQTAKVVAQSRRAGTIVGVYLLVGTNGADGTDALSLAADVLVNTVSCLTTQPAIAKAAGTGRKSTYAAGTGITVGVLDATAVAVAVGDLITTTLTLTRTTPETEIADVSVVVVIRPTAG